MTDEELRAKAIESAVELHKAWLAEGTVECSPDLQLTDIRHIASIFYSFCKGKRVD